MKLLKLAEAAWPLTKKKRWHDPPNYQNDYFFKLCKWMMDLGLTQLCYHFK